MIAMIESYRAGLLTIKNIKANSIAGIVVGIVALPLALAFAIASGVKPEQGIYTAIIAGIVVALFGGTRAQISGPTGAFVVVLAAITAKYGVAGLQVATALAGVMLCVMGLLRLGNAIRFIPYPVVVGFTSGIAVIIFVGQWKDFFGLPTKISADASFYQKLCVLGSSFAHADMTTTVLACISLAILIAGARFFKKIPAPLLALIVATCVQMYFSFATVSTIGSVFGSIPRMLPHFEVPYLQGISLWQLVGPACTIALLGAFESLLSATVADSISGTKHDSNQELVGQGLANLVAPFFGGFASTGAIARTVMNIKNGGNCFVAAVVHSLVLVSVLLFFAPYAKAIPLCVLSAILFMVAYNMSEIPHFVHVIKDAPWYDSVVLMVTFLLTIFTDLVIAVVVGVLLELLFVVIRTRQTEYKALRRTQVTQTIDKELAHTFIADGVVYTIEGPIFFGVTEKIERTLKTTPLHTKYVVFRLSRVPFIDISGLEVFAKVIDQYKNRGTKVYIAEATQHVSRKLPKNKILKKVEQFMVFDSLKLVADHYVESVKKFE